MHLVRVAFLVWLAALSASPAKAIEICSDVSAEGGIAACGDIRADSTRQLGAAVGDGITAALAAFHDLNG